MTRHAAERQSLVEAGRRMVVLGLTHGATGNLSVRVPEGFLVTPTGSACDRLEAGDLVLLREDGRVVEGGVPSSEWRIHRDVYAGRPDAGAVAHAHPPHATALSCLRRDLPAIHYMMALAGGPSVRCAGYATFGSAELSARCLEALAGRQACLLANHGAVALGAGPGEAVDLIHEVERLAEVYLLALRGGEPVILPDEEIRRVAERLHRQRRGEPLDL